MSKEFKFAETELLHVTMPLHMWRIVADHLRRGVCHDVYDVLTLIYMQTDIQINEAEKQAKANEAADSTQPPPSGLDDITPRPDDKADLATSAGSKLH